MGSVPTKLKSLKDGIATKIEKWKTRGKDDDRNKKRKKKSKSKRSKHESSKSTKSRKSKTLNGHTNGHAFENANENANRHTKSRISDTSNKPSTWQGFKTFFQRNKDKPPKSDRKKNDDDHIKDEDTNEKPNRGPSKWQQFKNFLRRKTTKTKKEESSETSAEVAVKSRMMAKAKIKMRAARTRAKQRLMTCFRGIQLFWTSIKLTFARFLYIAHALLTIWQVTVVLGNWYWSVSPFLATILIEVFYCVFFRKGIEWKWFQPCILLYLLVELPSVWLLELERTSQVQISFNSTQVILADLLAETEGSSKTKLFGLKLSHKFWTLLLEQSMMVLIIIARWLQPKGNMTRDQLSGLLLYYLGTASDLVDFFSVLAEDDTFLLNTTFVYTVLATWSWSMFQFVFVVTQTVEEPKDEEVEEEEDGSGEDDDPAPLSRRKSTEHLLGDNEKLTRFQRFKAILGSILESEAWAITVSMVMQDGPFAVVRCLCLFYWGIRTYTNYFFTFKNVLILFLQSYRLLSVYEEFQKKKAQEEAKAELDRKTHQVGVTLAAVSAFKKGGRKRAARIIEESDEESLDSARSEESIEETDIEIKPTEKPKVQPHPKFLTTTLPNTPTITRKDSVTTVETEVDDDTDESSVSSESESESGGDNSDDTDSETDLQSQASTIHKAHVHAHYDSRKRRRSRKDSVASSNMTDISTDRCSSVTSATEDDSDESEMSTPRVKPKSKFKKSILKRRMSRDIDTIIEMENDSSETEV